MEILVYKKITPYMMTYMISPVVYQLRTLSLVTINAAHTYRYKYTIYTRRMNNFI